MSKQFLVGFRKEDNEVFEIRHLMKVMEKSHFSTLNALDDMAVIEADRLLLSDSIDLTRAFEGDVLDFIKNMEGEEVQNQQIIKHLKLYKGLQDLQKAGLTEVVREMRKKE